MKKIRNIGLMMGLVILLTTNSKAQYFYTSFGYTHDWNLPGYVSVSVHDHYYGYDIAHVERYTRHGDINFNVLLHRNGRFVELRYDRHGHIYKTIRHDYYPLLAHSCTNHCGYHHNYYRTYYTTYHPKHHKTIYVDGHIGHKHYKHTNYYTNVYVEQPNKKHSHYNSGYHNSSNTHGKYENDKQRRTKGEIRNPQNKAKQHSSRVVSYSGRSKQTVAYSGSRSKRDR